MHSLKIPHKNSTSEIIQDLLEWLVLNSRGSRGLYITDRSCSPFALSSGSAPPQPAAPSARCWHQHAFTVMWNPNNLQTFAGQFADGGKIPWRRDRLPTPVFLGFPCGSAGEESTWNEGDLGSIPGIGRSPGEGNWLPLQYSGLENSMGSLRVRHDWATFTFTFADGKGKIWTSLVTQEKRQISSGCFNSVILLLQTYTKNEVSHRYKD